MKQYLKSLDQFNQGVPLLIADSYNLNHTKNRKLSGRYTSWPGFCCTTIIGIILCIYTYISLKDIFNHVHDTYIRR